MLLLFQDRGVFNSPKLPDCPLTDAPHPGLDLHLLGLLYLLVLRLGLECPLFPSTVA